MARPMARIILATSRGITGGVAPPCCLYRPFASLPCHSLYQKAMRIQFRSTSSILSSDTTAEEIPGSAGQTYKIQKILQDKPMEFGRVYLAIDGDSKVVLKEIPQEWDYRNEIYQLAAGCSNIRFPIDEIPERRMMVFGYLDDDFLDLAQPDLPLAQTKRILQGTLQAIAHLHGLDISHNDIKPNNILVQRQGSGTESEVQRVLLTDLEDAVQLNGEYLRGQAVGNFMWRSPEAHAEGPMRTSSDIFAFGIVCMYAMTKRVIFQVSEPNFNYDAKVATAIVCDLSYFSDEDGIQGLLEYLGEDNRKGLIFEAIEDGTRDVPKLPFAMWQIPGLDDDFKDLVGSMTKLDPRKRITA